MDIFDIFMSDELDESNKEPIKDHFGAQVKYYTTKDKNQLLAKTKHLGDNDREFYHKIKYDIFLFT